MKKFSVLLLAIAFLFSSCKLVPFSRADQLTALTNEEAVKIEEMSNEIIRCFTEKDKEGLKKLFCEQTRKEKDFDKQVDSALNSFLCEVYITSDIDSTASGGESYDGGKRTSWDVSPSIPYIKVLCNADKNPDTDLQSRFYEIDYYWHIVNVDDTSLEGLQCITLKLLNDDGDGVQIGEYIG